MKIVDNISGSATAVIKPLVFVALIVVVYFVARSLLRRIRERKIGRAEYDKANTDSTVNYDNYAKSVHNAYTGWFDSANERDRVAGELMALNNDELKLVYNRYDELFGGKGTETMYDVINDVWLCVPCVNRSALLKRMEKLGII